MDEKERQSAFMSALVTEHFTLQTAAAATISEAAARASLYILSLSSSLVAMGVTSRSPEVFRPFAAAVLPALFVLGFFTVVRLIDTGIENRQFLRAIARIRGYYRTLTPEADLYFPAEKGRRPPAGLSPPLWAGSFVAFFTTAASMIAFINSIVAGAGVALLASNLLGGGRIGFGFCLGVAATVFLMTIFLAFQRWRYSKSEVAASPGEA